MLKCGLVDQVRINVVSKPVDPRAKVAPASLVAGLGRSHGGGVPDSSSLQLKLDWLVDARGPLLDAPGRVALSSCPGRPDLGQGVEADVQRLLAAGIRVVVSLVDDAEMEFYGAYGLRGALREARLHSIQFPIVDAEPPEDLFAARSLCTEILGFLGEGENVLVHCIGGWGRTGTIVASLLTHQGYSADDAIDIVRMARSRRCVESAAQERFVQTYAAARAQFARYYIVVSHREQLYPPGAAVAALGEPARRRLPRPVASKQKLLSAEQLPLALRTQKDLHSLLVLSGERPIPEPGEEPLTHELPLDRAFKFDGKRWFAVPFAQLGDDWL